MRPVAIDLGPRHWNTAAIGLEPGWAGGDPHQPSGWLEHIVGARLDLAADSVEHNIADTAERGEILLRVVDHPVGPELFDVIVVAGTRRRDHPRADMLGELDREPGDPAGAALDQHGLASHELRDVFERPDRGQ